MSDPDPRIRKYELRIKIEKNSKDPDPESRFIMDLSDPDPQHWLKEMRKKITSSLRSIKLFCVCFTLVANKALLIPAMINMSL